MSAKEEYDTMDHDSVMSWKGNYIEICNGSTPLHIVWNDDHWALRDGWNNNIVRCYNQSDLLKYVRDDATRLLETRACNRFINETNTFRDVTIHTVFDTLNDNNINYIAVAAGCDNNNFEAMRVYLVEQFDQLITHITNNAIWVPKHFSSVKFSKNCCYVSCEVCKSYGKTGACSFGLYYAGYVYSVHVDCIQYLNSVLFHNIPLTKDVAIKWLNTPYGEVHNNVWHREYPLISNRQDYLTVVYETYKCTFCNKNISPETPEPCFTYETTIVSFTALRHPISCKAICHTSCMEKFAYGTGS